jgi:hypothetical protein
MNERGWFTLLVRGVGLVFAGKGLYGTLGLVLFALAQLVSPLWPGLSSWGPVDNWSYLFFISLGPLVCFGLGLYLLFRGDWLVDRFCRETVGRCGRCGYDVTGVAAVDCPECRAPLTVRREKV